MATSTEMMKDRESIDQVIQQMKKEKNQRHYRVFQAMRLMRREYLKQLFSESREETGSEEYGDDISDRTVSQIASSNSVISIPNSVSKRLKEITVAHIKENFQKLGTPSDRLSTTPEEEDEESVRSISHRYSGATESDWVIKTE